MTSPATHLVQIEKPIYGGAFLARVDGKAVFVPLTLPGEQTRVRIVDDKRGYATAEVEEIVSPSPARIAPRCPYFGACGGCDYQHAGYDAQLEYKKAILRETFERGGVPLSCDIDVLAGEPWGYRNRVRLAFDAAGNPGYRGRKSHAVISIGECLIAAPALIETALALSEVRRAAAPALRPTELSLFCNAGESETLASVFISRPARFNFDHFAQAAQERVPTLKGIELVVEAQHRQAPATVAHRGATSLSYRAAGFDYRVDHGAFFQVNRYLIDTLVERVIAGRKGKLAWDLFAGVGLFARNLAAGFERVIAVESAPGAAAALAANLSGTSGEALALTTLDFLRGNSKSTRPDLIVADPPRTGLGSPATELLAAVAAPSMVYVSCDPATLVRDLRVFAASGYSIHSVTLVDMFPQTFHLETIVELRHA
jgi:23S rRNA (uracil1939-C5)-methyltransferase